jgi:hypothetical protein
LGQGISINIFFVLRGKILRAWELTRGDIPTERQDIGSQELAGKILWNKELSTQIVVTTFASD